MSLQAANALQPAAADAMRRAAERLAGLQAPDGRWSGTLTPASPLDADAILLTRSPERAGALLSRQLEDGGFSVYPGGPPDAGASVKAYAALRLAGAPADALSRLRNRILELGGIEAANEWAKYPLRDLALDELRTSGSGPLRKVLARLGSKPKPQAPEGFEYRMAIVASMAAPGAAACDPLSDTALAALALAGCRRDHPALERAASWLLAHTADAPPDVSAASLLAVAAAHRPAPTGRLDRLLTAQSKDGGWASADATGRVLEALAEHGLGRDHASMDRGVAWLVRNQETDGSWRGQWGVAHLYGTCFALRGLAAAGESDREAHVLRGGEWLRSIQNADGGWGESCASFANGVFTASPSAPSQTAWAILGLIAGGDPDSLSVRHGIDFLVRTQRPDGGWDEDQPTAVGLPGMLYLRHELYKEYFPLMALAAFAKARLDG